MQVVRNATEAFRYLNGIFCVYKPSEVHTLQVRKSIIHNLVTDLNEMETRPPKDYIMIEGPVASGKPLSITVKPSLSDHPLVVGPRYQPQDIRCRNLNTVGKNMSGVQLYALNDACGKSLGQEFWKKSLLQVIEVKGELGYATDTGFPGGRIVEKATYRHVYKHALEAVLCSIQAQHRAAAIEQSGINIESQEAYEAACKGVVRPEENCEDLVVDMMCTEFKLPFFTLRMRCFQATDNFFAGLIPEIGVYLKSCAVCTQIRQIQYGPFTLDYALLRKHWRVEHVISNILLCKGLLSEATLSSDAHNIQPLEKSKIDSVVHRFQEQVRNELADNYV